MKVSIASKNPVKIQSVKTAFEKVFANIEIEISGIEVESGVSEQPLTDEETLKGAENRAENAQKIGEKSDFYIGIEGGLQKLGNEYHAFAWVVIKSSNKTGKAKTATFILPQKVSELIEQGYELGHADDIVFGHSNSKQKNGAVGLLTKDATNRSEYYSFAVILALIPFLNEDLY
jgi:inosine/xanthosine triphosphatase